MSGKEEVLKNIYLPTSTDTLVVGTATATLSRIDFQSINENFAKCSRDFFVCQESSSEMRELLLVLSSEAEVLGKDEIEQLVKEVILES